MNAFDSNLLSQLSPRTAEIVQASTSERDLLNRLRDDPHGLTELFQAVLASPTAWTSHYPTLLRSIDDRIQELPGPQEQVHTATVNAELATRIQGVFRNAVSPPAPISTRSATIAQAFKTILDDSNVVSLLNIALKNNSPLLLTYCKEYIEAKTGVFFYNLVGSTLKAEITVAQFNSLQSSEHEKAQRLKSFLTELKNTLGNDFTISLKIGDQALTQEIHEKFIEAYGEHVSALVFDNYPIKLKEVLSLLSKCPNLQFLRLGTKVDTTPETETTTESGKTSTDLSIDFRELKRLQAVIMDNCSNVASINFTGLERLAYLALFQSDSSNLENVAGWQTLTALRQVSLHDWKDLTDISALKDLNNLGVLEVLRSPKLTNEHKIAVGMEMLVKNLSVGLAILRTVDPSSLLEEPTLFKQIIDAIAAHSDADVTKNIQNIGALKINSSPIVSDDRKLSMALPVLARDLKSGVSLLTDLEINNFKKHANTIIDAIAQHDPHQIDDCFYEINELLGEHNTWDNVRPLLSKIARADMEMCKKLLETIERDLLPWKIDIPEDCRASPELLTEADKRPIPGLSASLQAIVDKNYDAAASGNLAGEQLATALSTTDDPHDLAEFLRVICSPDNQWFSKRPAAFRTIVDRMTANNTTRTDSGAVAPRSSLWTTEEVVAIFTTVHKANPELAAKVGAIAFTSMDELAILDVMDAVPPKSPLIEKCVSYLKGQEGTQWSKGNTQFFHESGLRDGSLSQASPKPRILYRPSGDESTLAPQTNATRDAFLEKLKTLKNIDLEINLAPFAAAPQVLAFVKAHGPHILRMNLSQVSQGLNDTIIPQILAECPNLSHFGLYLIGNSTREVTLAALSGLATLPQLKVLVLGNFADLTNFNPLAHLPNPENLNALFLRQPNISSFAGIERLANLETLTWPGKSRVNDFSALKNLKKLVELDLNEVDPKSFDNRLDVLKSILDENFFRGLKLMKKLLGNITPGRANELAAQTTHAALAAALYVHYTVGNPITPSALLPLVQKLAKTDIASFHKLQKEFPTVKECIPEECRDNPRLLLVWDKLSTLDKTYELNIEKVLQTAVEVPEEKMEDLEGVDIGELADLFKTIKFSDTPMPGHIDRNRLADNGTPITIDDVREGIDKIVTHIREATPYTAVPRDETMRKKWYADLEIRLKHVIKAMKESEEEALVFGELINIGAGGHRCGSRWRRDIKGANTALKGDLLAAAAEENLSLETTVGLWIDRYKQAVMENLTRKFVPLVGASMEPHIYNYIGKVLLAGRVALSSEIKDGIDLNDSLISTVELEISEARVLFEFTSCLDPLKIVLGVHDYPTDGSLIDFFRNRVEEQLSPQQLDQEEWKRVVVMSQPDALKAAKIDAGKALLAGSARVPRSGKVDQAQRELKTLEIELEDLEGELVPNREKIEALKERLEKKKSEIAHLVELRDLVSREGTLREAERDRMNQWLEGLGAESATKKVKALKDELLDAILIEQRLIIEDEVTGVITLTPIATATLLIDFGFFNKRTW